MFSDDEAGSATSSRRTAGLGRRPPGRRRRARLRRDRHARVVRRGSERLRREQGDRWRDVRRSRRHRRCSAPEAEQRASREDAAARSRARGWCSFRCWSPHSVRHLRRSRTSDERRPGQRDRVRVEVPDLSQPVGRRRPTRRPRTIRTDIARRVEAGETDDEIRAYLVGRFGEESCSPRGRRVSGLVWVLPVVALVAAVAGLVVTFRRWRADRRSARPTPTATGRAGPTSGDAARRLTHLRPASSRSWRSSAVLLALARDLEREHEAGDIDDATTRR